MCQSPEGRQHSAQGECDRRSAQSHGRGETTSLTDYDRLRWRVQGKCYQCLAWFISVRSVGSCLFEKLFVNLFDIEGVFDPASGIVADHQTGELTAVYLVAVYHDPLAQELCGFPSRGGKS
jgi:hypothetical protein